MSLVRNTSPHPNQVEPRASIIKTDDVSAAKALFDDTTQDTVYEFLFGYRGCSDYAAADIIDAFMPYIDTNFVVGHDKDPRVALLNLLIKSSFDSYKDAKRLRIVNTILGHFSYTEAQTEELIESILQFAACSAEELKTVIGKLGLPLLFRVSDQEVTPLTLALHRSSIEHVNVLSEYYDGDATDLLWEASCNRFTDENPNPDTDPSQQYEELSSTDSMVTALLTEYEYTIDDLLTALSYADDNPVKAVAIAEALVQQHGRFNNPEQLERNTQ